MKIGKKRNKKNSQMRNLKKLFFYKNVTCYNRHIHSTIPKISRFGYALVLFGILKKKKKKIDVCIVISYFLHVLVFCRLFFFSCFL